MGIYDSSRTRVQPIFDALYRQNKTGTLWLTPLLKLAKRPSKRVAIPNWLDPLVESPKYEFPVDPPRSFLRWLLENPINSPNPLRSKRSITREKREKLFKGIRPFCKRLLLNCTAMINFLSRHGGGLRELRKSTAC